MREHALDENHTGTSRSTHSDNQMLYTKVDRPHGREERGGLTCNGSSRQKQNQRHNRHADNSSGPSTRRGSQGGVKNRQGKVATNYWYCSRRGYRESEFWKKKADLDKSGLGRTEQGNRQWLHYAEGSRGAETGPTFVMKHKANSMKMSTSKSNELWYVDSSASNHMKNHEEWFSHLEKPEQLGVVETGDDTTHPIQHIRDVPLSHVS